MLAPNYPGSTGILREDWNEGRSSLVEAKRRGVAENIQGKQRRLLFPAVVRAAAAIEPADLPPQPVRAGGGPARAARWTGRHLAASGTVPVQRAHPPWPAAASLRGRH